MIRLLILLCLAVSPAFSSDVYYAQSSAGGNTGANCANAKALSGLTWTAANNYHQCGTVTSQVAPGTSGSAGNPITIIFEAGAKISQGACGSTGCIDIAGLSYIIIDGSPTATPCGVVNGAQVSCNGIIEATNSGTGLGSGDSNGIYARGCSHCEIRNLNINSMYVHTGSTDVPGGDYYAIQADGTSNLFHNNIINNALAGIKIEAGSSGNSYYNNVIHNINWGIFESAANSVNSITNELIYGNEIYDFANWDTTTDDFHHDGLFLSGNSAATDLTHVNVYNNYVHGTSSSAVTCAPPPGNGSCMTAYIYINTDSHVNVFNNLLVANPGDTGPNNGWILMFVDDSDSLYNNTIVGGTTAGPASCMVLNSGTNFTVKNNVMTNCSPLLWLSGSPTFTSSGLDWNTYQSNPLTGAWRSGGNFYNSIAAWRTATSLEANSQATTGSLNLDGTTYIPQTGSVVIGAATNLTSLSISALDSDKAGVGRPSVGNWDAGAYQYVPPPAFTQPAFSTSGVSRSGVR